MRRRFLPFPLSLIVAAAGLAGVAQAAHAAELGAVSGFASPGFASGAIAGSFFTSAPMLPPRPSVVSAGLAAGFPSPAGAPPAMLPAGVSGDPCEPAIASASAAQNLPPGLLEAIAKVESGRLDPQSGSVRPWPWTIDANGTGYMYPDAQAAIQAASGFEAAGISSLDIGCLQVNLAQHPEAFQTLAQAFEPAANARYAAGFLTSLEQKFGNWPQAVAAYHSQTAGLGAPYAARVYAQWQGSGAAPLLQTVADPSPAASPVTGRLATPAMGMPLPTPPLPQTAFLMSSMAAPLQMPSRQFGAPAGRSLASYRAQPVAIATSPPNPEFSPQG